MTGGASGRSKSGPTAQPDISSAEGFKQAWDKVYEQGWKQIGVDPEFGGVTDAFVTALDADGSAPLFSTFLGGSGRDEGAGIAVGRQGVFVTGQTWSPDAVDGATLGGRADAFVDQLAGDGAALLYAGLLGGAGYDAGRGIALGPRGHGVYVAGETLSTDFPTTPGAVGELPTGGRDGFVTKLGLDVPRDD